MHRDTRGDLDLSASLSNVEKSGIIEHHHIRETPEGKYSKPFPAGYITLGSGCCQPSDAMIKGKGGSGYDLTKCEKLCDENSSCHGLHIASSGWCRIYKKCTSAKLDAATCGTGVAGKTWHAYRKSGG